MVPDLSSITASEDDFPPAVHLKTSLMAGSVLPSHIAYMLVTLIAARIYVNVDGESELVAEEGTRRRGRKSLGVDE